MAVVVSIARGHDASYPFKTIGSADGATLKGERGAGYYLSAVEKGGEPAGIWIGNGAAVLGLNNGDTVRREDFEPLYGQFLDPRDPARKTYMGSPPRINAALSVLYQAKLATHPGATADERMRLLTEARSEYEGPVGVQYWDTTFAVDKTTSLAHASALASAMAARQTGDQQAAGMWEGRAAGIWAEIEHSVRLYVGYMQEQARFVRTGHHGRRIDGVEAGRFEDAREVPVAIFPQHTNRNGDPQLHVHILWLNKVQAIRDGQWRAVDARGLYRNKGAGAALAAFALETGLSRRFGFEWSYRPASKGRVLAGFPEKVITQFSSRRTQITKTTLGLADAYERERGHAPDQRALTSMRQFAFGLTRRAKDAGALDFTKLLAEWEQTSHRNETGSLRDLARVIWPPRADADTMARRPASRGELTPAHERAAMAAGLAQAQETRAAFTRADVIHSIARSLPDHAAGRDQEHAIAYLQDLAGQALAGGGGEQVLRLDAPDWPPVPEHLRRADGESIYRQPGLARYATAAQLSMEQRMICQAQAAAAPHLTGPDAAMLLGADQAAIETHIRAGTPGTAGSDTAGAQDADADATGTGASGGPGRADTTGTPGTAGTQTGGGLRLDQATAAYLALTSPRRVELVVGPAGTGKTYTAVRAAAAWRAAGKGDVLGIATTSAGRNVMTEAGIPAALNTAQFLGHLPGQPGARGAAALGPGALLILDEASMTSMPDLAAIISHATASGAKVIITGDHAQLSAVESGGGMEMLTRKLGYAQLTDAVRFGNTWEGDASLGIRAGETAALGIYDEQGRLHGGTYDEMAERAARDWLAAHLSGQDVLLIAYERHVCADLSRRVQGYLRDWGQIDATTRTALTDGAAAHPGDLIIARQNDNKLTAGQPGRTLANGDLLRVEQITGAGLTVRRQTGHDEQARARAWSQPFQISRSYAAAHCDLGYAVTTHTAEGRTVGTGIAVASDSGDREGLYVAMSRGRDRNEVYAYPAITEPGLATYAPGTTPDIELARQRRLDAERADPARAVTAEERDPVALLAKTIRRDREQLSATETRERSLSNADHLGVLHSIWADQTRSEAAARYEQAVRDLLPPQDAELVLAGADSIWRTVRSAEFAGLDGTDVLRSAITGRPFTGARSYPAVLAARIQKSTGHLPPKIQDTWVSQIPSVADPEQARLLGTVAGAMDDRQRRIGEHAADTRPLWATRALGDIPDDPVARGRWADRAGRLGAYREITGYDHPGEAIGPEPGPGNPEARAAWHAALAIMTRIEGIDVRHLTDGQLLARRRAYETETAWAPKHVAAELRAARRQEQLARTEGTRHRYEADAAVRHGKHDQAAAHQTAARSWQALGVRAGQVREILTPAHDTRREWEAMTEPTRRLARAADIELHRRGVLGKTDVLASAEPDSFQYPEEAATAQVWVQPRLDGGIDPVGVAVPEPEGPAEADERAVRMLGLTLDYDQPELPVQVREIADYNRQRQAEIDERRTQRIPSEDPDQIDLGEAWTTTITRQRDAIIQPPKPLIPASEAVLERAAQRDVGRDAGEREAAE